MLGSRILGFSASDPESRPYLYSILIGASLICLVYFTGSALIANDYGQVSAKFNSIISPSKGMSRHPIKMNDAAERPNSDICNNQCRPPGSEALPKGIVAQTSNLEMRPLWNSSIGMEKAKPSVGFLAVAVGIKQKAIVTKMVEKFLSDGFTVMLFHYDGVVDEWSDLDWNDRAMHVSAKNQTKWWFAKRFLHPDIIADYDFVFLWDEDLEVENFHPQRYLDIVKRERLEISQPALDSSKSVVHHPITARKKKSEVHRRVYKFKGSGRCDENSTAPPCIGWVEMMAPAFSKTAWRCVWYMIQNDLIHAWGLDRQLGYCAQGDRTKNVGVVDSEYIVHLGLPTLGVFDGNKAGSQVLGVDNRSAVRRQSFMEMQVFSQRWKDAVKSDKCWLDLYKQPEQ